jgi:hypothetical protein
VAHILYHSKRKGPKKALSKEKNRIESSMDTVQERRKHWYALSSTNLWIGFTWYWISKFTSFLKKANLLLAAVETYR